MKTGIIDIETNGITKKDSLVEIGFICFDWDVKQIVRGPFDYIINEPNHRKLTGIKRAEEGKVLESMIEEDGIIPSNKFFNKLIYEMKRCDFLIAHNITHEVIMLKAFFERYGYTLPNVKWLCSQADIEHTKKGISLETICTNYEIVNMYPHRAWSDALTVLQILQKFKLEDIILNASGPMVSLLAPEPSESEKSNYYKNKFLYEGKDGNGKDWWRKTRRHKLKSIKDVPYRIDEEYDI